jgi:coenzyme PQQ biosynthesis protein A
LLKQKDHRILLSGLLDQASNYSNNSGGFTMKWETPSYTDLRFGFEVTMYIYNR